MVPIGSDSGFDDVVKLRAKGIVVFKQLSKIGKAFMLPVAILPAAGLLLGIGGALSNPTTVAAYPILDNHVLQGIFGVMSAAGATVFENLAILLAVGLCIGLAKRDKGTAALAGVVGYLVMVATIKALLGIFTPDAAAIDTGVVGALVVGGVAVMLHNRFHNIALPAVLGFFGGSRFVPIVTAFAAIIVGAVFFIVWPPVQQGLVSAGEGIAGMGAFGTFLYGSLLRLSGAAGLHHMIYPMFWYTPLGGTEIVNGVQVVGAQKIFFAQLADPNHVGLFTEGTRFFAGRFEEVFFGRFDHPLGDGVDAADARGRIADLAGQIPAHHEAEVPVGHFEALSSDHQRDLPTQDIDANHAAFTGGGATALAEFRQGASHLLVALFFVGKAAEQAPAETADLLWVERQVLFLRHADGDGGEGGEPA